MRLKYCFSIMSLPLKAFGESKLDSITERNILIEIKYKELFYTMYDKKESLEEKTFAVKWDELTN